MKDRIHYAYTNRYCPLCHAFNAQAHEQGCTGEKVDICASARLPKKNASKKVWKEFNEKFVEQKDLKERIEELKKKEHDRLRKDKQFHKILRKGEVQKD